MVKRNWGLCVFSAAMAFVLSTAGIACLLTAFEVACSIEMVLFWCAVCAVVWSVAMTLEKSWIPMAAFALVLGYVWRSGSLQESINSLVLSVNGEAAEQSADCLLCLVPSTRLSPVQVPRR